MKNVNFIEEKTGYNEKIQLFKYKIIKKCQSQNVI